MTQLDLNLAFGKPFLVGCRVDGVIQHYTVDAYSVAEARQAVRLGVAGAKPVLAVLVGGKKDKPVAPVPAEFTQTRA